ncbi:MAG: hypothetical protein CSB44_06750 [Gammaproteobacteria bacterium]|nr:MAG: hypothetical protein CSB44_06750 [Gammaproteobacteria bacterium]
MTRRLAQASTLFLFSCLASLAKAEDGHLVFHTYAHHFKNADERNDFTPGIGWEYSPSNRIGWHVGTLSDSFGYQAWYVGLNYATRPFFFGRVRLLLGATALHKQYKLNAEPETKFVPLPAIEFKLGNRSTLNVSGSPEVDYGEYDNNAVIFFQYKLGML